MVKQYASRPLKAIALFFMGFPITYLFAAAILFDMPARACLRVLLEPSYYIISGFAVVSGYGLWELKRWSWYLFLFANLLVAYENVVLALDRGESHHPAAALFASLLILIGIIYRVAKDVRVPYLFPKIRWWESNPRYRLSAPAHLVTSVGPLDGQILDISLSGCFIKLRSDLKPDESITVSFRLYGQQITCQGAVVWQSESTVTHPKGVGIKFLTIEKTERRKLRLITRRLKRVATLYRRSRYLMNQDEFVRQLDQIEAQEFDKQGA